MNTNCIQRIQEAMPNLTEAESKIAEWILAHPELVINMNVADLAQNADVSEASIVRFTRRIGCKGYIDFKMKLARDILPEERQYDPVLVRGDNTEQICRKIFSSAVEVRRNTPEMLDMDAVYQVCVRIRNARRLVIFGTGGSLAVALDAQHKLMKIGISAIVHRDIDMQLMSSSALTEDDAAICISFSGHNYNTISCLRTAKMNGAFCISIVSQRNTPLAKLSDIVFISAYDETIFQSESTSTRIAQLTIIDCIVGNIALIDYGKYNEAIQKSRDAVSANKV